VALGLVLPTISNIIGAKIYVFVPFFQDIDFFGDVPFIMIIIFIVLPHLITVGAALVMYRATAHFDNRLKYIPVICGYGGSAYCYMISNLAGEAAFGLIIIPYYSLYFFIGGYWLAWSVYVIKKAVNRKREKRQQSAEEFKTEVENASRNEPQMSESGEPQTAWQAFLTVSLWIMLVCFGLFVALPSSLLHASIIVNSLAQGELFVDVVKMKDILFFQFPVVILITGIVMMLHRRLKIPVQRHDKFVKSYIVALGLVLPTISNIIGAKIYGFVPVFQDMGQDTESFWAIPLMTALAVKFYPKRGRFVKMGSLAHC
jgi:nitrate reductase gamma subunit